MLICLTFTLFTFKSLSMHFGRHLSFILSENVFIGCIVLLCNNIEWNVFSFRCCYQFVHYWPIPILMTLSYRRLRICTKLIGKSMRQPQEAGPRSMLWARLLQYISHGRASFPLDLVLQLCLLMKVWSISFCNWTIREKLTLLGAPVTFKLLVWNLSFKPRNYIPFSHFCAHRPY